MEKQIIKRIIMLNIIFALLMIVYRIIFVVCYGNISNLMSNLNYLIIAFIVGFIYDMVILVYINIVVVFVFVILLFINSKKLFLIFISSLKYYYTLSFGSIISILCIGFGFYYFYSEHINPIIFDILNHKLSYLWFISQNEHVLLLILFLALVLTIILTFFVSKYILEKNIINFCLNRIKIKYKILLSVFLIILSFLLLGFYVNLKSYRNFVTSCFTKSINSHFFIQISLSPIYTFYSTIDFRIRKMNYILEFGYENNIRQAFSDWLNIDINSIDKKNPEQSLLKVTKYNRDIEVIKPNVILIVMESLDSEVMFCNSPAFNVLGEFKKHLDEDIVFYNCLYSYDLTALSLNGIILNLIMLPKMKSPYNKYYIPDLNKKIILGLDTYKKNKYLTIYVSPKIIVLDNFKFDIYDYNITDNDENVFNNILRQLKVNNDKKFIYAMTISNHHPFSIPKDYKPLPLNTDNVKGKMQVGFIQYKQLLAYQYSCQKVGEFLTKFKKSKYADNTIVAITGDHGTRGVLFHSETAINRKRVPLYIYVPKKLMPVKKNIDTSKIIAHVDIMPTLYELSLSSMSYYSMGNDILNKNKQIAIRQDYSDAVITDSEYACKTKKVKCFKLYRDNYNVVKMMPDKIRWEHEEMIKKYKAGLAISQYIMEDLEEKH